MSPSDERPAGEDPDIVAERIVDTLRFLLETAETSDLTYLMPHLTQCVKASEDAYINERRGRYNKPRNGGTGNHSGNGS